MSTPARSPAEIYDELFVPAVFGPWGRLIADTARISPGDRVLDVACGTGALTTAAAERAGAAGHVVGLDVNDEMLAVARRKDAPVEWHTGRAEALPFPDDSFDAVVSQFGFMFFEDQAAGLREMMRVARPGGRLSVAVCDALDHSPGYAVLAELLHRLFGGEVAQAFRAPFSCGDRDVLSARCAEAGIGHAAVTRLDGAVEFPSIDAMVASERACAWTLGGLLDDAQFERLRAAAQESFQPFETARGTLRFEMPMLVVSARKA